MAQTPLTLDGFSTALSRGWVWGRRLLWTAGLLAAAVVLLEAVHLYELLARIHPWVARSVVLVLLTGVSGWLAYVAGRYLRLPRAVVPPRLPEPAQGWSASQRRTYAAFAERYLRRQLDNPHLPQESVAQVPQAIETIRAAAHTGDAEELTSTAARELDRVLAPLDGRANQLIRRAAVEVATATAVSPSVLLDSLITLSRNVNLISKLADLYYGRPGPLGTLRILRAVLGSAAAAGALEIVSDHLSGALVEMTGSWSSRLIGPLGQGMVNGVVTMRFGAAARWRCRSLQRRRIPWRPWELSQYRRAASSLLGWIGDEVGGSVVAPLRRVVDWTGRAVDTTVRGGLDVARKAKSWLGGEPPEAREIDDDPLVQSGLLDEPRSP